MGYVNFSKFRNKKTVIDGLKFDSKKEANRWLVLKMLERSGEISNLQRQVPFILLEKEQGVNGETLRQMKYIADFVYNDKEGNRHVEDVKGVRTDVYKIKKRLMWHIHKINVEEV